MNSGFIRVIPMTRIISEAMNFGTMTALCFPKTIQIDRESWYHGRVLLKVVPLKLIYVRFFRHSNLLDSLRVRMRQVSGDW
jgi:hypothetical protein